MLRERFLNTLSAAVGAAVLLAFLWGALGIIATPHAPDCMTAVGDALAGCEWRFR